MSSSRTLAGFSRCLYRTNGFFWSSSTTVSRRRYASDNGNNNNDNRPTNPQQFTEPPAPSTTAPDTSPATAAASENTAPLPPLEDAIPAATPNASTTQAIATSIFDSIPFPDPQQFNNTNTTASSTLPEKHLTKLMDTMAENRSKHAAKFNTTPGALNTADFSMGNRYGQSMEVKDNEYHLHVYSHKHNTHMAFTTPNKDPLISMSCGNCGFKKSNRSTYEASYTLASTVFQKIEEKKIRPASVEVILRGFGVGRDACMKALIGREGRFIRPVVSKVTDGTRLKFGGTRSRKARRL